MWKSFADSVPLPVSADGMVDVVSRGIRIVKDASVQTAPGESDQREGRRGRLTFWHFKCLYEEQVKIELDLSGNGLVS